MSKIYFIVVIWTLIQSCYGVIYNLNESDYNRMPPLYDLSDYNSCINAGHKYCTMDFSLVTDTSNELYDMILEYTAFVPMHFNYTRLLYGRCLSDFCPQAKDLRIEKDLKLALEGCLNETFTKTYDLQTRMISFSCSKEKEFNVDIYDMIISVCLLMPFVLAMLGSAYHLAKREKKDNKFLMCFSVVRNTKALFSQRSSEGNERSKGLSVLYGMRAITSMCVILTHETLPLIIGNDNPKEFEDLFKYFKYIASGTQIVQTFFIMSGFLLAYNTLVFNEKVMSTAFDVPKRVFMRWLRLTPPVLFLLGIICTWLRFTENGPMWQTLLGDEVSDCRKQWWPVPLYYINYVDHSQCMPELWYLAADFQLTIVGLTTLVLFRGRARVAALVVLMVVGMIVPSYLLYTWNADIATVCKIQTGRDFFINDISFNYLYKRTHNNLTDYVMGVLTGMLVYRWQNEGKDLRKYSVLKYLTWSTVPIALFTVLIGVIFYEESGLASVGARIVYLVSVRLLWGGAMCWLLVSAVFGVEKLYSSILSSKVWTVPARLSYAAYITHVLLIRSLSAYNTTLAHVTPGFITYCALFPILLSYVVSIPIWVLIEAPVANLIRMVFSKRTAEEKRIPVQEDNPKDCRQVSNDTTSTLIKEVYKKINDI